MKKILSRLLLAGALCLSAAVTVRGAEAVPGVVRVKLQNSTSRELGSTPRHTAKGKTLSTGLTPLDASLRKIKGYSIRKMFPCPPGREAEHAKYGLDQWYEICFDETVSPLEAQRILRETAGVMCASTRAHMVLFGDETARRTDTGALSAKAKASPVMPFNDPRLSSQWHYTNFGDMPGAVAGADINLFEAWKVTTGDPKVVVAVVDGGVDYRHEDLAANMWVNPREIPGNGIDDDNNGYVDDIYGFNFCTMESQIAPHDHGTHVAGTIAAVNNNGKGVCGVAGGDGSANSGVRLMSCQVFDSRSGTPEGDFARALVYAADNGATIANCSWGSIEDGFRDEVIIAAVKYFTLSARSNNMTGGLCIFASGNEGLQGNYYPPCLDEVLAVGAITHDLHTANYSNYGTWVDVSAPGGYMDFSQAEGILSTLPDNGYGYMEGTSMAAPHVTGIAALVLSKYGSPTLTSASLKTQLETSVNDLYTNNPGKEGYYGNGYIDAAKALMWGDGTAPEAPSSLSVLPAQDNITVQWVIPASSDNNVHHHVLYYSTTPFTAESDLLKVPAIVIDTKFMSSGEPFSYELEGLAPLTTYYIALKAVNRWGDSSALSEVLSATTNAGPRMSVDRTSVSLSATGDNPFAVAKLKITNSEEGLLKWNSYLRTRSATTSLSSIPTPQVSSPYNGRVAIAPFAANETVAADYVADEYPRSLTNSRLLHAFIGDVDKDLPNSLAQLFYVDPDQYPDGFNLTHVNLQGSHGDNAIIEIYRGAGTISPENLIMHYEPEDFSYYTNISLPEQLYMAPGEYFYVVYHFPLPQKSLYPLGMGLSNGSSTALRAYMSNDMGETWTLLSHILKGSTYEAKADEATWAVTAISNNPDWSSFISLDPVSGQVNPNSTAEVDVTADASKIVNGSYRASIHFDTNESEKNSIDIPVTLTVTKHKPDIVFNKIVNFGDIIVGDSKTITVEVFNRGYGVFGGRYSGQLNKDNIKSTSEHFTAPTFMNGMAARSTARFDVTYAPKVAGSHSGQIVFTDVNGETFKVTVQGVATDPAVIAVEPAEALEAGELEVGGDSKSVEFTIKNEGNYPLQFVMPKYSQETIEGVSDDNTHKFGYIWQSNLGASCDVEYEPMPVLEEGVNVAKQFGDNIYWSKPVNLGFDFPFFGQTYNKVYISSFGAVSFGTYTEGAIYAPIDENDAYIKEVGYISAFGNTQLHMAPNSVVEYAKQDGKFIVNFKDVLATIYDRDYTPISFHIVLDPNGDVEMYYNDIDPDGLFGKCSGLFVALTDPGMNDPIIVTSSNIANKEYGNPENFTERGELYHKFVTGAAVKFMAPMPNIITDVNPVIGVISPKESVNVKVTVAAGDEMSAGPTFTNLAVLSNDPVTPARYVRINADITGDLYPEVSAVTEEVDFGEVFRTSTAHKVMTLKNSGRNQLVVNDITIEGGKFGVEFDGAVGVLAGRSKDFVVTMPTDVEGEIADKAVITTNAGTLTIDLKGTVIGCPDVTYSYDAVDETLEYRDVKPIPLTITNTGDADMLYAVSTGAYVRYSPVFSEGSKVEYEYEASVDEPSAKRDWVDIETTGLGTFNGLEYYLDHDYMTVELPFEFPYYDKKYSKMHIYNTGFISFTERNDDKLWPEPPAEFPEGTVYKNLIAPYWGMHSMDQSPTSGIYHYLTDDEAVISFTEYGNAMNVGIDYQVILRKDGTFTFNYKGHTENAYIYSIFGVAGISNEAGDDGINLPERVVSFGNSVNFTPVVENPLAAGESVVVDLNLEANIMAGDYASEINVTTNVPGKKIKKIPVSMKVEGEAIPEIPSGNVIENVAGYMKIDPKDFMLVNGAMYYDSFTVRNLGSAEFTIKSIDLECATVESPYTGADVPVFNLMYFGHYIDDIELTEDDRWMLYNGKPLVVGRDEIRFAVPMLPSTGDDDADYAYTPGEYPCRIIFNLEGVDGMDKAVYDLLFVVTPAPSLSFEKEEIRIVNAKDGMVKQESIKMFNDGEYKLRYEYYLDLTGVGEDPYAGYEDDEMELLSINADAIDTASFNLEAARVEGITNLIPTATGTNENVADTPASGEFSNYLYWPASNTPSAYTYGSTTTYYDFKALTRYETPEGGFNISAIYILVNPYKLGGRSLVAEIVNGDGTKSNDVLGKGIYTIPEGNYDEHGLAFAVIPLNRAVYLTEGQDFSVVVTYPAGAEYPVGLVSKRDGVVEGRYMGYSENFGKWVDIAAAFENQAGSVGYVATCLEKTPGAPWVKLLDEDGVGEIEVDESGEIRLQISADSAPKDHDNKAVVVIKTNDPDMPIVNYPVYLDRNVAPAITAPAGKISVNENETEDVEVQISDADGDDFALRLDDAHPANIVSIKSVELVDAGESKATVNEYDTDNHRYKVLGSKKGVKLVASIAPDFGHAGNYSFTVTTIDRNGHESDKTVDYTVVHVNRAPEAVAVNPIEMVVGSVSKPISLASLFREPDGETMTYNVTIGNDKVAEIFTSGDNIVINAKAVGSTELRVMATDESESSTTNTIKVNVTDDAGVDGVIAESGVSVYPNPVKDILYVTTDFDTANANLAIYTIAGQQVMNENSVLASGKAHPVNVSTLPSGTYVLRIEGGTHAVSTIVIKN